MYAFYPPLPRIRTGPLRPPTWRAAGDGAIRVGDTWAHYRQVRWKASGELPFRRGLEARHYGGASDQKREYWRKLIAEQGASGQTIRAFCKARGIGDHSFYFWRKQLRKSEPVQFALLKPVASA